MRNNKFFLLLFCFILSAAILNAQRDKVKKDEKFDKKLVCPFANGMGREPKEAFT